MNVQVDAQIGIQDFNINYVIMLNLYETDFHGWTKEQVQLLQSGKWHNLDITNLVEELESLGKQQQQELKNRLGILIGHLLKWHYQPHHRSKSWRYTIEEQRLQILDLLAQNPSLKPHQAEAISKAYQLGLLLVGRETPLDPKELPSQCPYTLDQLLDTNFPEDLHPLSEWI